MEFTINQGRDVMTLCAESLLSFAMKMTPGEVIEERDVTVIFGVHDVCKMEAENFDKVLETA